MKNYKNFNELNVGDHVFSVEIENSSINQNCVGGIVKQYLVMDVTKLANDCVGFTLSIDKRDYSPKHVPGENKKDILLIEFKNGTKIKTIPLRDSSVNKENGKVNCEIFATNIITINDELDSIVNSLEEQAKEYKREAVILSTGAENIKINKNLRIGNALHDWGDKNVILEKNEVVVLEPIFV